MPLELVREGLALLLAGAERLPMIATASRTIGLPDLPVGRRCGTMRAVVKLVHWDGSLAAATMPDCRVCFILRHPCGQVASVLAGSAGDRFQSPEHDSDASVNLATAAAFAATRGVDATTFKASSEASKLAWRWLAFNEPIVERLRERPNARIVIYEDLCRQPEAVSGDLFTFAGLHWHKQTSVFLAASTHHDRPSGYYDVYRQTSVAPDRWRERMNPQDQEDVRAVVRASLLSRYWDDLSSKTAERTV